MNEIDEERGSVTQGGSSRNSLSTGFNQPGGGNSTFYNQNNKNTSEYLEFKNAAKEKGYMQSSSSYNVGKNYHIENSELLVKFIRFNN